jgi:hypothetical protein
MQTLINDVRYGARKLIKNPLFTIVAIVTLALGIGANTAIFSVVNAVLLRSLPYYKADQLVIVSGRTPSGEGDGVSQLELDDFRAGMASLDSLVGFQSQSVNLTGNDRPDRIRGAFVSYNFFEFFHVTPIVGRTFAPGEDKQGAPKNVVVNEKMWRERLNSAADLSSKKLILNGEAYSVIGVVTQSFIEPFDPDVEAWMPLAYYPSNSGKAGCAGLPPAWAGSRTVSSSQLPKPKQQLSRVN